jgi:DNA-binding NtrC family response regulator
VFERPTERQLPVEGLSGFRLLVVSGNSAETFSLPASGEVAIGRGIECHIRIDDARLSRCHAVLAIGPELVLRDSGSANGCFVGGHHLGPNESVAIAPGMVIVLGGVTLVIQRGHASSRLRHVRSHDYFEARVEDECARAEASKSMFSVARIRCRPTASAKVEAVLSRWLRPMDVVALYAPDEYELLLVDTAPDSATQLCDAIMIELSENALGLTVCSYPQDARSPEGLSRELARVPESDPASGGLSHLGPELALVARGSISVLLLGETGVGKEVAANAIHRHSRRAKEPLVSINCAAFSEALLESELFGHERGAFTGAHKTKMGLIESADGGTFFLDEVGEMPPSLQVKLLRVLEHKEVMKIGAVRPRSIDVRFIAATNRDLEAEVTRGAFRRDLYYRLAGATVSIPPLRERADEILGLASLFIAQSAAAERMNCAPRLSDEARDVLVSYNWPGNVRELRNVIERAVLLCREGRAVGDEVEGFEIRADHLPKQKMGRTLPPVVATVLPSFARAPSEVALLEARRFDTPVPFDRSRADTTSRYDTPLPRSATPVSLDKRDHVVNALAQCAGNQTQAARVLGISRRTLVKRLDEYALPRPRKSV